MIIEPITEITKTNISKSLKYNKLLFIKYKNIYDKFELERKNVEWVNNILLKYNELIYNNILRLYFDFDNNLIQYDDKNTFNIVNSNNGQIIQSNNKINNLIATTILYPPNKHNINAYITCFDYLKKGGNLMISIFNLETIESWRILYLGFELFDNIILSNIDKIVLKSFNPKITKNEFILRANNTEYIPYIYNINKINTHYKSVINNNMKYMNLLINKKYDEFMDKLSKLIFKSLINLNTSYDNYIDLYKKVLHITKRTSISITQFHSGINDKEGGFIERIIKKTPGKKVIEIGMAFGISTLHITSIIKNTNGMCISIDPFQKSQWKNQGVKLIKENKLTKYHTLIQDKSYIALPELLTIHKNTFDFIFIDGWHTFDYTLVDFFYSDKLLKINGYILIDDIRHKGVQDFVKYISNNYKFYKIIPSNINTMICFQKNGEDNRPWDFHTSFT